ncbi:hypothetical protein, partial [Staphylococcus aureus]|uniref:hypothetical protein n=1 Tax=Staphylococcus aureus TaxID=1280 RepID=UPI003D103319
MIEQVEMFKLRPKCASHVSVVRVELGCFILPSSHHPPHLHLSSLFSASIILVDFFFSRLKTASILYSSGCT